MSPQHLTGSDGTSPRPGSVVIDLLVAFGSLIALIVFHGLADSDYLGVREVVVVRRMSLS